MSLFRRLGKEAEELKQTVTKAAKESATASESPGEAESSEGSQSAADSDTSTSDPDYRCEDCGETFAADWDECPECGGQLVSRGSSDA